MALEGAKINILLSILGTAIVTILIAGAYSIGVSVGKAAAGYEDDSWEPVIYMEHTHRCAVIRKALRLLGGGADACL